MKNKVITNKLLVMENQIVLSKKNCHRAAKIRQIAHPEYGDWDFEWRGQKLSETFLHREFAHIASKPGFGNATMISDTDNDMKLWEVVSWKYEINFENLWNLAVRAFDGTSFSPEERAAQYIRDYETTLINDLTKIPEDEQARYIDKYTDWVRTLFDKHSRCLSTMIAGPSNFPTRRAEKANNSYDNAVKEFSEWREKALKAIARRIEEAKPEEQRREEEWESIKSDIDYRVQRGFSTVNLYNRLETLANNGKVEIINKVIEYIKELGEKRNKPIFTNRHKFWKLPDVAKAAREAEEARANKEDAELSFDGGIVVKNYREDRLQIIFNAKPASDVISNLKHHGFRWSPRFGGWQRQLTLNAYYAATRVIPVTEEQLKKL